MVAKRYVRELASDFRKWYQKKCKEYPDIIELPAGFLREANETERMCEHGLITNREAAKKILMVWEKCEDWIWEQSRILSMTKRMSKVGTRHRK